MENGIMSIEEIKAKVKQPLKGLAGVRFLAENFTTLSFRQGDIASVKLHKLIPSCPELFDFGSAPEFSRYFKTDYARIRLRPCADNMNRFDWMPDTMKATRKKTDYGNSSHFRYLSVFERLLESPNIVEWQLFYEWDFWYTGTERCLVVSLPYKDKYEGTGSWHEHNILQSSYLDEEGCLNIEIKAPFANQEG